MSDLKKSARGVMIALIVALAASFVAAQYGGPAVIYAVLFGIGLSFLYETVPTQRGIDFCTSTVLRWGVALLGTRITFEQIGSLGNNVALLIIFAVSFTIIASIFASRVFGLTLAEAALIGGSVAICGASAAIALSAVLPQRRMRDEFLLFTVVGVTAMSTVAMILYPLIATLLGLTPRNTGIVLGGSIHDVAQVVGAGYLLSPAIGDTATVVKLLRVSLLAPAVLLVATFFRSKEKDGGSSVEAEEPELAPPVLPWFIVVFGILVGLNSAGWIPHYVASAMTDASRWCILIAMTALGLKTSLGRLSKLGWRPAAAVLACSSVLLMLILVGVRFAT